MASLSRSSQVMVRRSYCAFGQNLHGLCQHQEINHGNRAYFGIKHRRRKMSPSGFSLGTGYNLQNHGIYNLTPARLFSTAPPSASSDCSNDPLPHSSPYHTPVMVNECITALLSSTAEEKNRIIIDGTLGGGGHSSALLSALGPGDIVIGCDVDPAALETASIRLGAYLKGDPNKPTFVPLQTNFRDIHRKIMTLPHPGQSDRLLFDDNTVADGLLLDLGVSSHQIDTASRGFSFSQSGPLDMRMSASSSSISAADVCNTFSETDLTVVLKTYGEEPRARKIARSVVEHRPIRTTEELAVAVGAALPGVYAKQKRLGLTATLARVFQSLRIVVNDEMGALREVLEEGAPSLLALGYGRLVVMSYHSLEDRMVKRVMKSGRVEKVIRQEKDIYGNIVGDTRRWKPLGKGIRASDEEVQNNSRARSAMLRVAERLDVID